ncbi:uncharacterized protein LOC123685136 [Harmonia axyridis]|uniref:uncharacterized protein LOC123685136 n=1 Tax=Harmonia axyridis TaxID=115357 RepID=UPI001E275CD0|nr:uncharacterized protein LOC123685136 [Harmonia axyridis]XP_045480687.1 uncharacterized protein LOC123685136 [Harmonia axyridis]
MYPKKILILSLAIALVTCAESKERNFRRLVGGHLKVADQTSNDAELLDARSSGSNDKKKADSDGGAEEEKKTLAQQVADGKYGLIQKELFKKPLKQPGIISYDANPEVPKDNINSLGGLSKEDIWLAENHLLVIKGGTYPKHSDKFDNSPLIWPAIDNYTAPKRPVKLPSHPKVPPPFPVQLTEDGPLQILGTNSTRTLDVPPSLYALPPPEGGYVPGTGPYFPQNTNTADAAAGGAQNENPKKTQGEGERGRPFPPSSLNGTLPPFFAHLPPGAVAVPPPPSINDFDEDDPSIYYPPPYSFSYPSKDNSSWVPAGPLVPGIILPPPPDFFAPEEETPTTKKTPKRPVYTKRPKVQKTTQQSPQIHPTTTPIPPTSVINITLRKPIKVVPNSPADINNELKPIVTTTPATRSSHRTTTKTSVNKIKSSRPHTKRPSVTILKPVKSVQSHRTYYNQAPSSGNPFKIYGPPRTTTKPKSSTQVPLQHYYTTADDINSNVVTVIPERNTAKPTNYYYYEEDPQTNSVTTPQSNKVAHNFFNLPNQYFEAPRKTQQPRTKYVYVTSKPFNAPSPRYNQVRQRGRPTSFNLHLEKLKEQIEYFSSPRPVFREIQTPRAVYQYSFQASKYKPADQNNFRPSQPDTPTDDEEGFKPMPRYSVQIQQAVDISTNQTTPYPPQNPIYFKQSFRATTEKPLEQQQQRYYTTAKPKFTFNNEQTGRGNVLKTNPSVQYTSGVVDHNNGYSGYFFKQGNGYYEDSNDKNKQIDFGQRIPSHTTAVPSLRYSTQSPKVVYVTASSSPPRQAKPISLEGDTLVNYKNPRPNVNPDAELIPVDTPQRVEHTKAAKNVRRPYNANLEGDSLVNYVNPRPNINQNDELIPVETPQRVNYHKAAKYVQRPYNSNFQQEGDTLVNYLNPRPAINPDAELIPVDNPQRVKYHRVANYVQRPSTSHNPNFQLEGDTLINYINPRPNINPDSELIPEAIPQRAKYPNYLQRPLQSYNSNLRQNSNGGAQYLKAVPISVPNEDARRGSFISYSLPGNNGAHFYFLTPQLAQSTDQGADFYYSQRDSERIRRNNRGGNKR